MDAKKITVKSPANIAFIKYWGQKDQSDIIPYNDSFSMNLSHCFTIVTLELQEDESVKELYVKDYKSTVFEKSTGESLKKVLNFYSRVRVFLKTKKVFGFRIYSENSFPKKAGIASSASFFSGLTLAFLKGFGVELPERQRSILARLSGSGSACRSIPDGFCWWKKGKDSETSYAETIARKDFWALRDIVLILSLREKNVTSQEGHRYAKTSPFFFPRLKNIAGRAESIRRAFFRKDLEEFGTILEQETISLHSVMMTQTPPLYYWSGKTMEVIKKIIQLRAKGTPHYFTIDAGENIHVICEEKDEEKIVVYYKHQPEVEDVLINCPSVGSRIVS